MPLFPNTMISAFLPLFQNGTPASADAAKRMATAYTAYCQTAVFGGTLPIFTGLEEQLLETTLLVALTAPIGLPGLFSNAWQIGIKAFWLTPPILTASLAASGQVGAMPGADSVAGQLTALFANPLNTAELAATELALTLDSATRTLTAVVTPPGGTPVPVS